MEDYACHCYTLILFKTHLDVPLGCQEWESPCGCSPKASRKLFLETVEHMLLRPPLWPSLLLEHLTAHLVTACQLQVQLVPLDPLLPASVLLFPLLHAHEGITFPDDQCLNIPVVQALCVLIKLHPDCEIQVIVSERAVGFCLELIAILLNDLGEYTGVGPGQAAWLPGGRGGGCLCVAVTGRS